MTSWLEYKKTCDITFGMWLDSKKEEKKKND